MNTPDVLARRPPDVSEVHVIWMTTGLGCDGIRFLLRPPLYRASRTL
jgi:hypothetical protein